MCTAEFNDDYFSKLLEHLNKKKQKKNITLMGDFNINLLHYDKNNDTNNFLNLVYSASLIPHIVKPTRITTKTKTLIDNIFSNLIEIPCFAGNFNYPICDHLPQFAIFD